MLTIEHARRAIAAVPHLALVGLGLLAAGVAADVAVHVTASAEHAHGFSPAEVASHLIVFVGMVVILLGVVADGVRQSRSGRSTGASTKGGA